MNLNCSLTRIPLMTGGQRPLRGVPRVQRQQFRPARSCRLAEHRPGRDSAKCLQRRPYTLYISGEPADNAAFKGEVWSAARPARNEPFGNPSQLFSPEPGWSFTAPSVSSDELSLYVQYTDLSRWDADVYVSHRESVTQPWGEIEPVPELSDPNHWQSRPCISADNLAFFFYNRFDLAGARPEGPIWP